MNTDDQKRLVCQIIGHLLISDGLLTDAESAYMERMLTGFGLSTEERGAIINGINIDAELDQRLADMSEAELRELIDHMKEAASIDGDVAFSEQALIARVHSFLLSR